MGDLATWLPAIITACSVVAMFVTMREQVRHLMKRLGSVERKLDGVGDHERLRTDVSELKITVSELRDVMLRTGDLQPARRTRTPVRGVPALPQERDSEET